MSKLRETPCKNYICKGQCNKGRDAEQFRYCQHCNKYEPRVRERHINKKKAKLLKMDKNDYLDN